MALSFNGLEPVAFGGKECTPKIDAELKLRLSQIKKYDESVDEILASAFPDDEVYVSSFIKDKMTIIDKQILHAYLMGGDTMVNTIMNQMEGTLKDETK